MRRILEQFARNLWSEHQIRQQSTTRMTRSKMLSDNRQSHEIVTDNRHVDPPPIQTLPYGQLGDFRAVK